MEIGSEFSNVLANTGERKEITWLPYGQDHAFVFSGRTAIETIIQDIHCKYRKVLLPSYCCESMIEPFMAAGYAIKYYEVTWTDRFMVNLCIPRDCGVLFWCNYFGFRIDYPLEEIRAFQARGGIVIEDITHSLFSQQQYHSNSDYLVASLRKWGALLSGGFCSKSTGFFAHKPQIEPDQAFLSKKLKAMELKEEYLQEHIPEKKAQYLRLFTETNQWFEDQYSGVLMDEMSGRLIDSWNIEDIRTVRRKNAAVLYRKLTSCPHIRPLFSMEQMDCPLFVPVCLEQEARNQLRKALIQEEIYCPIHWPQPGEVCQSSLYDTELSLICDQRYSEKDMERICQVIMRYFGVQ